MLFVSRSLGSLGSLVFCLMAAHAVNAQIVPDNTLSINSSVEAGCTNCTIEGGTTQGNNLFHSFREFSIPTGGEAFFNNAAQVQNIFTRVTGNSISNIDGLLRTNGSANLFLLNPNGMIFGSNARLDLRGSFVASTADRFTSVDGQEFSATNPQNPPLLKIHVPIGLQPGRGDIIYSGKLSTPEHLTLSARNLSIQGQLRAEQDLTLEAQNQLQVQTNSILFSGRDLVFRAPVRLLENANYTTGGYLITERSDGTVTDFLIPHERVVIAEGNVTLPDYQGGSLYVLAGGQVTLGKTTIAPANSTRQVFTIETGAGSTQPITVNSRSDRPSLDVRAGINWNRLPKVRGNVTSNDLVPIFTSASGADINSANIRNPGGDVFLTTQFQFDLTRSAGNISVQNITTRSTPDSGNIRIAATGNVTANEGFETRSHLSAGDISLLSNGTTLVKGFIGTQGGEGVERLGRSGDIEIRAQAVDLIDSLFFSGTLGSGRGGSTDIQAQMVNMTNTQLFNGTSGSGRGGDIRIQAQTVNLNDSQISVTATSTATSTGVGGNISIQADVVNLFNGSALRSSTSGTGQGGEITIDAASTLELSGVSRKGTVLLPDSSRLIANTFGRGNAGGISISTGRLILRDAATISSSSGAIFTPETIAASSSGYIFGQRRDLGRGGRVTINAKSIEMSGTPSGNSALFTNIGTVTSSTGNAGDLTINTDRLFLGSGAVITTAALGYFEEAGRGGNLAINARELIDLAGRSADRQVVSALSTDSFGLGDAGNLVVNTDRLILREGAAISASTYSSAQGGSIRINANQIDLTNANVPSDALASGIYAQTVASGNAGDITISTDQLRVRDRATITTAADTVTNSRIPIEFLKFLGFPAIDSVAGNAGTLSIIANSVDLSSEGSIRASTEDSGAGDLTIVTNRLTVKDRATISVSSVRGEAGSLKVNAGQILLNQGSLTAVTGSGNGGNIDIHSPNIVLRKNSEISAAARRRANGGNISLNAREGFIIAVPNENSDIIASANRGNGGHINIVAKQVFGLQAVDQPSPFSEINASSEFGIAGTISITTPDIDPNRGLTELPTDIIDASRLIAIGCSSDIASQANRGEFYQTGRGGIAPSPIDPISSSDILEDLQPPQSWNATRTGTQIVEAQGWQRNDRGEVVLVATPPDQWHCER